MFTYCRSIEEGGQRALFICNTVELARQQAVYVKKFTNFKVGFYVGEQGTDNWNRSKWSDEIRDNQVSTQRIYKLIQKRLLSLWFHITKFCRSISFL